MSDELRQIKDKLDLIIHALGLDGKKSPLDIKQDVKGIVIALKDRRLTKLRKKTTKEACP